MAKRIKQKQSKSRLLKVEALEQRQLLASGFTAAQGQEFSDIVHANGNVYDQVLLKGSSITVINDPGQVTRVSFLDLQGDIVQAEFSGSGTLNISLDAATFEAAQAPAKYIQNVNYVKGLATFTIQGSDASSNLTIFSVGSATATNQSLFDATHTGGNNTADVQRITIVANPSNPNGSTFGSINAGNTIFTGSSGPVGISASTVQVQNVVTIGDINATDSATPTLIFGTASQFGTVKIAGGDLVSANNASINNTNSYLYNINLAAGANSNGVVDAAENTYAQLSFTGNNPVTGQVKTFELTAGIDTFLGTTGADKITGTQLSALDNIDGGGGLDVLALANTGAVLIPTNAKVVNVETATITSGADVSGDFSGWTGLTDLTVASNAAGTAEAITGGAANVNLTNSAGALANATGGTLTVNGGKAVTVSNVWTSTTVNTDSTGGAITVAGTSSTTSVSVSQSSPVSKGASTGGRIDGAVTITGNSTNLSDVSLTNYGATTITSNGLKNLTVSGSGAGAATISITNTTQTTLNLTASSATDVGTITDGSTKYDTLNITTAGSSNSKIANLAFGAVKTLAISGTKNLTLTSTAGLGVLETVTSTGAAGVTATFPASVKTIDFSASTAANSVVTSGTTATYAGGSGVDTVTISTNPTKAITGGGGTDVLVVNATAATVGGIGLEFANSTKVSGFETLSLGAAAAGTYDATGFTKVQVGTGIAANAGFNNVAAGVGLTITADPTKDISYSLAGGGGGTSDAVTVTLSSDASLDIDATNLTLSGIEAVTIAANDGNSTAHVDFVKLVATDAKTLTITGNAGLEIINTGNTKITSFDASAVTGTGSAVKFASANVTGDAAISIKGGAGSDTLSGTSQAIDTITGGAGDDVINGGGNLDVLTGGAGADTFIMTANANGNIYATITDLATDDIGVNLSALSGGAIANVTSGNLGNKISLAPTAAFADYLNAAASGHAAASAAAVVSWFQYNGDTYVVVDNTDADVFTSGAAGDQVIKLSGLVDLKTAVITGEVLTIV